MTLLLKESEVRGLLTMEDAIRATEDVVREEFAGTTVHMIPFGGQSVARGRMLRVVGGGMFGIGRLGLRAGLGGGSLALVYDTASWELLAILGYPFSHVRVGASMGLAARYLSRPDSRVVGLLGSGMNALDILRGLCAVRDIERVQVYSPTPEHRTSFAERATRALGVPITAHEEPEPVVEAADILALATNSEEPVVTYDQLRPGVHVTSMGLISEVDASLILGADQFVATSRHQEIEDAKFDSLRPDRPMPPLLRLIDEGKFDATSIIELGAIVSAQVSPRNGPSDITLYRDSRGGVGDIALANCAYDRARDRGLGVEASFK